MTYLLKNVAFNTHRAALPSESRTLATLFAALTRLRSPPAASRDLVAIVPNQDVCDTLRVVPCRYRCIVRSRFSKLLFFLPTDRISQETLDTCLHLFLSLFFLLSSLKIYIYIHTCVYIFCALPLDVPLGRSASCVLLLTNVQSARAVKTPRFAGTPVRSSHFLSLSLFFFQFSPEAVGIIFFFRPTYLFIRFIPFFSGNASYTFCVFAFILFSSASRHRHHRHCC